jgi:HlyD family secretion protein
VEAARASAVAAHAQAEAAGRAAAAATKVAGGGRAQAEALVAQRDAAKRLADRLDAQRDDVAAANLDQTRAGADALTHQAAAAAATADAGSLQAQVAAGQAEAARAQADAADRTVAAATAAADRAALLAAECTVTAPIDARVETLPWAPGELVPLGGTVAKLVELSEVTATFYLPNAELAVAAPGGEAIVEADAWPGETFRGTVATVASEAEFTPRNIQTRTDRDRLVYAVEVAVKNPDGRLRPGMPVQVTLPGTGR